MFVTPGSRAGRKRIAATAGGAEGGGRELLTADREYFVNGATGDDEANDGLSAGGPFQTIDHLVSVLNGIYPGPFALSAEFADGLYSTTNLLTLDTPVTLKSTNQNGAALEAPFFIHDASDVRFEKFSFNAQNGQRTFLIKNSIVYLDDIDASCGVGITPLSGAFITAEHSAVYLRPLNSSCVLNYANIGNTSSIIAMNYNSHLWAASNTSFIQVVSGAGGGSAVVLTSSTAHLHNFRIQGSAKADGLTCLALQRGSTARLLQNDVGTGLGLRTATTGIASGAHSIVFIEGTSGAGNDAFQFASLTNGITCAGGGIARYETATVTFTSVDNNTVASAGYTDVS